MIQYPAIDPILVSLGPLAIRWYGLTYVIAFAFAWWLGRRRAAQPGSTWKPADVDDLIFYGALGVILGGRIGWVLFYGFERLVDDPLMILRIWEGGMSFHGGLVGVILAEVLFARRQGRRIVDVLDFLAPLPGIGIFAVRCANFINGELWGKPTQVPWGFVVDPANLHPSQQAEAVRLCERFSIDPCVLHVHATQLYEGILEGLVVFAILWIYTAKPRPRLAPAGLFLLCYGVFRFAVEFLRVPDENRGYLLFDWVTMGQILSSPMIVAGVVMLVIAYRRNEPSGNTAAAK
ncbi:phosphatidylglycerol:prolipoprotein diacylglycerol transferase [Povalibacter uvarum]|uniref:Phosphatidylglycerol--prolipoprotein diacylglyceryl transferase n=1 Tax=Povalibacter uvarum TaxID=732238 RepID=A0A841HNA9_9GAMM|nr:prolipoprotein diacylglyceryl transferase [Povalibacter uvarum]MBB6094356.1 phosphatidylglycerol:prolipoprotein diacylglycerol transferase [Povalibacter uvarum]